MTAAGARRGIENPFAVDLRSLAAFRIALGATLLWDLGLRAVNLSAHYTDHGVFPATNLVAVEGRRVMASLHYWASASTGYEALLFVAAAIAAVALMLGYRTRIATVLCFALLSSLQLRNPWISSAGFDRLLRLLLFWSFFLPLDARASLDARRDPARADCANRHADLASAALLLQTALVYWMTGVKKSGAAWIDGTAIHYALNLDLYAASTARWIAEHSGLLWIGSHATRVLEIGLPVLAFSPWQRDRLRILVIVVFAGFHLTLALFLHIGLFPVVALVSWIPFVPGCVWDALERRRSGRAASPSERPPWRSPAWLRWSHAVAFAYLALFVGLQVSNSTWMPRPLALFGTVTSLNQYWRMFAPDVPSREVWLVFEAELADGSRVDALTGAPVQLGRPDPPMADRLDLRWRLWINGLQSADPEKPTHTRFFDANARYFCERWNAEHDGERRARRVRTVRIDDDADAPPPRHREIHSRLCLD